MQTGRGPILDYRLRGGRVGDTHGRAEHAGCNRRLRSCCIDILWPTSVRETWPSRLPAVGRFVQPVLRNKARTLVHAGPRDRRRARRLCRSLDRSEPSGRDVANVVTMILAINVVNIDTLAVGAPAAITFQFAGDGRS